MIPITPTASRVSSTSTLGLTLASFSPGMRKASPAKKSKICPARVASPIPSASVLPSSRESSRPSSSRRARISVEARKRMSCRSCGVERDQAGKAALAAATAVSTCAALARAYSPTTSFVLDGLTSRETPSPATHSPAIKFMLTSFMSRSSLSVRPPAAEDVRPLGSKQAPLGEIAHQRAGAEGPGRAIAGMAHAIGQAAKLVGRHRDDIAFLVSEPLAGRLTVGDRREHRPEKERGAVGILMARPDHLTDEVFRIAADLGDRRAALQLEALGTLDGQAHLHRAHVVHRECLIEEAQQRADGAPRIVVLGFAQ